MHAKHVSIGLLQGPMLGVLHRKPASGVLLVYKGTSCNFVHPRGLQISREICDVLSLLLKVRLVQHGGPDVAYHGNQGDPGQVWVQELHYLRANMQDVQIRLQHRLHSWFEDLDDDLLIAVLQYCRPSMVSEA